MAILLGVDTGGTYTDAVLIRDETQVIASAKALTTRHDLAIGIGAAVQNVLSQSGTAPGDIALASLSTTLATNALVEGQGGRAGLIYIGFREQDLEGHGLRAALAGDPALILSGGHNHAGYEARALDLNALDAWLREDRGISAYAVAAQFATRNPEHELAAQRLIQDVTGKPVSCSHHLSAKLNGPKRALTALLNARLIGMIARLIDKAEGKLADLGIAAPLMVVRGDGALISAKQARERPIETILSGPAASIVGARWLTGAETALVSDIGGTTTDVAILRGGKPMIDPGGAQVGPWRTMVEAVAMRTTGLGGDSEVHLADNGLIGGLTLGPRRVLPVSLIAYEAPEVVQRALDAQMRATVPGEHDGVFVRAVPGIEAGGLAERDEGLLLRIIEGGVQPVGAVLRTRLEGQALRRLVARGLVQVSGVTPSDASHVLSQAGAWDVEAAEKALALLARKRTGSGNLIAGNVQEMAQMIVDQLTRQTVLAILEAGFAEEADSFGLPPDLLARHVLMERGLDRHRGLLRVDAGLNVPVVGLGASAATYYPAVGARLGCEMILPRHAGVANAIGAIVGRVTIRRSGTVTSPSEGLFRVHLETGPEDHRTAEAALDALQRALESAARADAVAAGAEDIHITATRDLRTAEAEARQVFLEGEITVEASGRPRIAI
ncbi:N-methylhydantoinase A/oxoprolinase/acetone carboxylase, beta subunit [Roseovarius nanhaiticus]|uniref:N-methylhydantoinase A/oxoprolinase/acetone carboxylase, beta subunit n=1 Tax=Roseovarius nanhaiticus TaxID=573024 RepID=A0A1N7EFZ0_9RHOB|nr:hydantoinase/oxoprolinase family protein [Roseovarius nanhaiticus]SEK75383.1 N-methylhydantoinase A/oxoprolinase/acetone carboxylase, beta subunit [Roseovarius nanhaiticus]SIR86996.1 N-methylhydantoinase A/oxoprolinase/acetone carboxylase, beta subunit [Roseovarius nanhaiticus]